MDALARGTAPLIVSGAAGYPRGVNNLWIVYVLGVLLALSSACLVEALASYQYDDGDAVRQSSIKKDGSHLISESVGPVRGARFGLLVVCWFRLGSGPHVPVSSVGLGRSRESIKVVRRGRGLRSSRRPRFKRHRAPSPARGGFARASSSACVRSLLVLIVCFRLISYCFLARALGRTHFSRWEEAAGEVLYYRRRRRKKRMQRASSRSHRPRYTCATSRLRMTTFAPVVSGASFQIKSGECVSIVGDDVEATRALLRALAQRSGTTKRVAGAVHIQDVSGGGARVAWVPAATDHLDCCSMLDARSLVAYAAKLSGHDESHVEACLHLCGITHRERPVNYECEGEPVALRRRRIALACAATKAPVLFIDDACGLTSTGGTRSLHCLARKSQSAAPISRRRVFVWSRRRRASTPTRGSTFPLRRALFAGRGRLRHCV